MNIAVVTGASSGMGKCFALTLENNFNVEEMWVIARGKDELEKLKKSIKTMVRVVPMDLTKEEDINKFRLMLEKEKPNIKLLINASGYGKFEKTTNISYEDSIGMIKLNCEGLTKMNLLCLPYMQRGSKIINIASVAAYQPVPYINIYAATKAYVLSFSRSLNMELKNEGIKVLTVCPYWTKTKFFNRAVSNNEVVKKYVCMYEPENIVSKAWKDLQRGKEVSIYGFIAKSQIIICKLLPHKLIMKIWLKQQGLNSKKGGR